VEIKARLLKASGQPNDAATLLTDHVGKVKDALLPVAGLLEELGEQEAAEGLYRKHEAAPDGSQGALVLAAYLGRRGRFDEALDLIDKAGKTCPPEAVAFTAVAMLHAPGIRPAHVERVEHSLTAALAQKPGLTSLELRLATLRDLQGRYADAETVYRQILAREPGNVVALNNLAWLLAHRKDAREEALKLARQAVDAVGPQPPLLDTRALTLVNRGESEPAVKDLEQVLEDEPTPLRYFHLARAQMLAGDRAGAAATLRRATKLGFKADALHPLERDSYRALLKDLEDS